MRSSNAVLIRALIAGARVEVPCVRVLDRGEDLIETALHLRMPFQDVENRLLIEVDAAAEEIVRASDIWKVHPVAR